MNKVFLSPSTPVAGDKLKVTYNGNLNNDFSNSVYVHVGYTDTSNSWSDISNIQMYKNNSGELEALIPVKEKDNISFAFYDANGNWDNNNGLNYSFDIKTRPNW